MRPEAMAALTFLVVNRLESLRSGELHLGAPGGRGSPSVSHSKLAEAGE